MNINDNTMNLQHKQLLKEVKRATDKLRTAGYSLREAETRIMEILNKHRKDIDRSNVIQACIDLAFIQP